MGYWVFGSQFRCGAPVECRFKYQGFLLRFVLGARSEFYRTIAVVVPLHGQTADALALVAALPVVPGDVAKVSVHPLNIPQEVIASCWIGRLR